MTMGVPNVNEMNTLSSKDTNSKLEEVFRMKLFLQELESEEKMVREMIEATQLEVDEKQTRLDRRSLAKFSSPEFKKHDWTSRPTNWATKIFKKIHQCWQQLVHPF